MSNTELQHYGVAGMRWGKRRKEYNAGGTDKYERRQTGAARDLARSNDSKKLAVAKIAGSAVAQNIIAGRVGKITAGVVSSKSQVAAAGIRAAAKIFQVTNLYQSVVQSAEIVSIKNQK